MFVMCEACFLFNEFISIVVEVTSARLQGCPDNSKANKSMRSKQNASLPVYTICATSICLQSMEKYVIVIPCSVSTDITKLSLSSLVAIICVLR